MRTMAAPAAGLRPLPGRILAEELLKVSFHITRLFQMGRALDDDHQIEPGGEAIAMGAEILPDHAFDPISQHRLADPTPHGDPQASRQPRPRGDDDNQVPRVHTPSRAPYPQKVFAFQQPMRLGKGGVHLGSPELAHGSFCCESRGQALAALGAAAFDNHSPPAGAHALAKSVFMDFLYI